MNLDHKKKSNNGLIKIKEHQISRLLEQLKIRDEAIMLAQVELKKNNIKLLNPNELKKVEDLKIQSVIQLPSIENTNFNNKGNKGNLSSKIGDSSKYNYYLINKLIS